MLQKDKRKGRTIENSLFARKRRRIKKAIRLARMISTFRKNRKKRKKG